MTWGFELAGSNLSDDQLVRQVKPWFSDVYR